MPSKNHDLAFYELNFNSLTGSIHIIHYVLYNISYGQSGINIFSQLSWPNFCDLSFVYPKRWFSSKGILPQNPISSG